MSAEHRWSKFWWQDWQTDPSLRLVSLAAQGLWMRLLCIAHEAEPYGHVLVSGRQPTAKELSAIIGCATERVVVSCLLELERERVFSRTDNGTIFCRRMVKDKAASDIGREFGRKGGNPLLNGKETSPKNPAGGLTPPLNPPPYDVGLTTPLKLEAEAESESEDRKEQPLRVVARARPRPRRTALAEDWKPDEALLAFGLTLGMNSGGVTAAAAKMRDWAISNGEHKADWAATFRNWLRRDHDQPQLRRKGWDQNPVQTLQQEWGLKTFLGPNQDDEQPVFNGLRTLQ